MEKQYDEKENEQYLMSKLIVLGFGQRLFLLRR